MEEKGRKTSMVYATIYLPSVLRKFGSIIWRSRQLQFTISLKNYIDKMKASSSSKDDPRVSHPKQQQTGTWILDIPSCLRRRLHSSKEVHVVAENTREKDGFFVFVLDTEPFPALLVKSSVCCVIDGATKKSEGNLSYKLYVFSTIEEREKKYISVVRTHSLLPHDPTILDGIYRDVVAPTCPANKTCTKTQPTIESTTPEAMGQTLALLRSLEVPIYEGLLETSLLAAAFTDMRTSAQNNKNNRCHEIDFLFKNSFELATFLETPLGKALNAATSSL